jgi:hypothetical protein
MILSYVSLLGFRVDYKYGTDIDYLASLHEPCEPEYIDTLKFYLSDCPGLDIAAVRRVNQDTHTRQQANQEGQKFGARAPMRAANRIRGPVFSDRALPLSLGDCRLAADDTTNHVWR